MNTEPLRICCPTELPGRDIEEKGKLVRAIYVQQSKWFTAISLWQETRYWDKYQPRWDGGLYGGESYEPIWPKIARFIEEAYLPPYTFIEEKFLLYSYKPPMPDVLLSTIGCKDLVIRFETGSHHDATIELGYQMGKFRVAEFYYAPLPNITPEDITLTEIELSFVDNPVDLPEYTPQELRRFALGNKTVSPLLRYCLALEYGENEIANNLWHDAVQTYIKAPDIYNCLWKNALPENFMLEAFGVREHATLATTSQSNPQRFSNKEAS